jgi:hypothetical protein
MTCSTKEPSRQVRSQLSLFFCFDRFDTRTDKALSRLIVQRAVVAGVLLTLSACANPSDFGLVCAPGHCPHTQIDGSAGGGAD